MHMNLYLVFAAHFPDPNYKEALHFISLVIEFFQGKSVFDKFNTPGLSANIDRLIFEFVNQDIQEMNNMWSLIGAKYLPSVVYKVRMLTFSQSMVREEVPGIVRPAKRPTRAAELLRAGGAAALDALGRRLEERAGERGTDSPEETGGIDGAPAT